MAGAIVLGLCVSLFFFWACYRTRTPDGWRGAYNRSGGAPAATNQQLAVEPVGGDKGTGGGPAPASLSNAIVRTNPSHAP
jgi:hypothetical protein